MRYSRLELLIIGIGIAAVGTSLLYTYRAAPIAEEIVAQLLMVAVLIAAVHWGRNGGFIAATLASLIYILMRVPFVIEQEGLSADVASLILVRVVGYGLLGIVGGELCRRLRYFIARMESSTNLDSWSQVYNQTHISRSVDVALAQNERHKTPASVVLILLSGGLTAELRPSRERLLVRGVANHLRNDTRLVDEVGRLDDGRFLVLLPHTPLAHATAVADRLCAGVTDALGARPGSVSTAVLGVPENTEAVGDLLAGLGYERGSQDTSGS